jgi:hypothetical protein
MQNGPTDGRTDGRTDGLTHIHFQKAWFSSSLAPLSLAVPPASEVSKKSLVLACDMSICVTPARSSSRYALVYDSLSPFQVSSTVGQEQEQDAAAANASGDLAPLNAEKDDASLVNP